MALKMRVLFLCTGNSSHSQMAEALLRHQARERFEVFSTGTQPEAIDQRALEVLEAFGVATDGLRSKSVSVSVFIDQSFDFVITLCDKARQEYDSLPATAGTIAWDFEEPKTRAGSGPFNITRRELNERIKIFVLVQTKKREINL